MKYPEIKLGEVADIKGGKRLPKGEVLVDYDTGFPYIRAQDIKNGLIAFKEPKFITYELRQKLKNYTVNKDDVCITIVGAYVGDIGIVNNSLSGANLTENAVKLTNLKNNFDAQYLKYCLLTREAQEAMKKFGSGAAQDKLGIYKIKEIQIPNPPAEIQRKIAGILSGYDRLIENNTRRIEILEEMARSIYREWFVNFRFPGHEQVQMVDSELGLIPEGWEVKQLDDIVLEIIDYRGKTPKKLGGDWSESGILAISAKNIKQGKLINLDKSNCVDEALYKKWMKSELKQGDILMTSEAPLGELYYLVKHHKFCLSQRVYSIRANPDIIHPPILFSALYSPLIQEQIYARQSGTTVVGIRQTELRKVFVIVPLMELQISAARMLDDFFNAIETLQVKNDNLRQTRDLLLPRLISGEIDVENLEINISQIAA